MGRNVVVPEETVRDLLEAHASLSAWYYELWAALRAANATASTPDDAARAAFVERLSTEFPELAPVARSIRVPRMYVPAPPPARSPGTSLPVVVDLDPDEPVTIIEPAPARIRELVQEGGAPARPSEVPPPSVDPGAVKSGQ